MLQVRAGIRPTSGLWCCAEWRGAPVSKTRPRPRGARERWTNDRTAAVIHIRNEAEIVLAVPAVLHAPARSGAPLHVRRGWVKERDLSGVKVRVVKPQQRRPPSTSRKRRRVGEREGEKERSHGRSLSPPLNSCRAYNDLSTGAHLRGFEELPWSILARGTRARQTRASTCCSSATLREFLRHRSVAFASARERDYC